jgi:hypothetical protein
MTYADAVTVLILWAFGCAFASLLWSSQTQKSTLGIILTLVLLLGIMPVIISFGNSADLKRAPISEPEPSSVLDKLRKSVLGRIAPSLSRELLVG